MLGGEELKQRTNELLQNRNDMDSIAELVTLYEPLVGRLIGQYGFAYCSPDTRNDLMQSGRMGIVKAVEKFDETKASFTTFAYIHIRKEIQSCMIKLFEIPIKPTDNKVEKRLEMKPLDSEVISIITMRDLEEQVHNSRDKRIKSELLLDVLDYVKSTSTDYQFEVFKLYISGKSRKEINQILNRNDADYCICLVRRRINRRFKNRVR